MSAQYISSIYEKCCIEVDTDRGIRCTIIQLESKWFYNIKYYEL
jgi:hypothetical protein